MRSTHIQKTKLRYPNKMRFWSSNSLAKELSIQPCGLQTLLGDYCPDCRPDRMVYPSHRDCWKVTFSSSHLIFSEWSRFPLQTRPFKIRTYYSSVGCHDYTGTAVVLSLPTTNADLLQGGTPLEEILVKVRHLPAVLQLQIMSLLKGTMVTSLLQAKTFISELLPCLRARSNWTL